MAVSTVSAQTGSVIFIHPDGTSAATWHAARVLYKGPDGNLEWDKLPGIAIYRDHLKNSLTATSNGGGTTHAYGVKVGHLAYGLSDGVTGKPIVDEQGQSLSVMHQAIRAGLSTALVQTGTNTEPGTGCFVASVQRRDMHDEIAEQLIESKVDLILGGGERYFIPKGTTGQHGPSKRKDDKDLVARARELGYAVVYTRDQLLALPVNTPKVLGLFSSYHTFNDQPEEALARQNLPIYNPSAPTVGEMTRFSLTNLKAREKRFLLVVEEEGTDNLGNNANASGMFEAMRRADEAIGIAHRYVNENPSTLMMVTADSDAGGMRLVGLQLRDETPTPATMPARDDGGSPIDGVNGTGTAPFMSAPDQFGKSLPFYVTWATADDCSGGILVRFAGMGADKISANVDNTEIAEIIRRTLFEAVPTPADR